MPSPFSRRVAASRALRILAAATLLCTGLPAAAMVLGTPPDGATVSGVNVISGFHCNSHNIEIFIDSVSLGRAGTGTTLPSTKTVCGHSNTGYSLLYNFNNLPAGSHTITAYAEGFPFATNTVYTLQSGGLPWRSGLERSHTVSDFPAPGMKVTLDWVESYQNFVITGANAASMAPAPLSLHPPAERGRLGTPVDGGVVSGVGAISGYHCTSRDIEVFIDDVSLGKAGAGTRLLGTAPVCGRSDTGYSLLYNFNNLAEGDHVLTVHADGVLLDRHSFHSVRSGGVPWLGGAQSYVTLENFPVAGNFVTLDWVQSYQNFLVTASATCAAQETYNSALRRCVLPMGRNAAPLISEWGDNPYSPGPGVRAWRGAGIQFIATSATELGKSSRPIVFAYYEIQGFMCFAVGYCPDRAAVVHVVFADTGEVAERYPSSIQLPDGTPSSYMNPNGAPSFFARGTERGLLVKYSDLGRPDGYSCHEIRWVPAPTEAWASFNVTCPE